MSETASASLRTRDLALLVELEARWENLRPDSLGLTNQQSTQAELNSRQRAYEAFQVKQAEYAKKYPPGYVPAFHRGTSVRLAAWLRKMRDLYQQVEDAPQMPSPVQLLAKAYRCTDGLADKAGKERFRRTAADTVKAAVAELDALARWCEESGRVIAPTGPGSSE
jgi:hypothetical protein